MIVSVKKRELVEKDGLILDNFIPGHERTTFLIMGKIVTNPFFKAGIPETFPGFNMTLNRVPPLNGNALHVHKATEIFAMLDGKWEIAFGKDGCEKAILEPGHLIVVDPFECHSYKNISDKDAIILTLLPGEAWIQWHKSVVEKARANGAECDDWGTLIKDDSGKELNPTGDAYSSQFRRSSDEWVITEPVKMTGNIFNLSEGNGFRSLRTTPEGLTLASCVLTSEELTVPLGDGYTTMFCVFGKVSIQHDLFELEEWDTMLITRSSVMTRGQLVMKAVGDRAVVLMVYTPVVKRFENRMG